MRVGPTLDQLLLDYRGDLKIVYKNFIVHPSAATTPALAGCAAGLQGKFSPMKKLIWEKGFQAGRNLSRDNMEKLAREAKLSMSRFKRDMDGVCKGRIQRDRTDMARVGARGTPAFFINGRFLSGARPIGQFKSLIDEELAKANDRVRNGARVKDYYGDYVVRRGKKSL